MTIAVCGSERGFNLRGRVHLDHLHAQHADGMVVDVARLPRHHHFVLQPVRLGSRCIFSGSAPAMQAAVACVSAAAQPAVTMPHSALRQLRQAPADGVHQLVEVNVGVGRLFHGLLHFGQRLRAAR